MRNLNIRSEKKAKQVMRSAPIIQKATSRRLSSVSLGHKNNFNKKVMKAAHTQSQVNHNIKTTMHVDNFNKHKTSPDGFQHESQQIQNVMKQTQEVSHVQQKTLHAVSAAAGASAADSVEVQLDDD